MNNFSDESPIKPSNNSVPSKSFGLDRANGKIGGVCAGIGQYFGVDPMVVRLGFLAGVIFGFGSFGLIYLAIWAIAD